MLASMLMRRISWSTSYSIRRALSDTGSSVTTTKYDAQQELELLERPTLPVDSPLRRIDFENMSITRTPSPRDCPPVDTLIWGEVFSDHMLEMDFDPNGGWSIPKIVPFHNFPLSPAAPVLHYGLGCFEGLKAFSSEDGDIRLFRPSLNMARFNKSASRLHLPNFDEQDLLECLKTLISVDQRWVPRGFGYSLYIRPTLIATSPRLGVFPSKLAKLFIITSPCGLYFPGGFKAIKLYANNHFVRAWPGGAGDCKVGGNYAPTLRVSSTAAEFGCSQVLWLLDNNVQEVGTTNIFFLTKTLGKYELITPPLSGTILPGVTRQSCLDLSRHWGHIKVTERPITIQEVRELCITGRMVEAFCTGTAAVVTPVKGIYFEGDHLEIPLDPANKANQIGPFAKMFHQALLEIQHGKSRDFPVTTDGEWNPLLSLPPLNSSIIQNARISN